MEEAVAQIKAAGEALAATIAGVTGPLAERAKALISDATAAAVQAYVVAFESQHSTPVEEPPVDVPDEPAPEEPTHTVTRRRR